jgi:type IV pilus assembly protein PilO
MKRGAGELIFFVVILGLLGGTHVLVFKKMDQKRLALNQQVQQKQRALADLSNATAGVAGLDQKIDDLQKTVAFFDSRLPEEREVDTVLKEVWQLARDNSLQTRTVKTLPTESIASVRRRPIEMTLSGDFRGFYSFLLQLEKLPRLTRITDMDLAKINENDGEMTAKVTLSIFFEPDSSPMGASASAQ